MVFLQQFHETSHQFLTAGPHISLECLDRAVTGKRHDVIHRITPFIEVRDATPPCSMKADHAPFGLSLDMRRSAPMFFIADTFIDTTTSGEFLDGFIGFANMYDRKANRLIMSY